MSTPPKPVPDAPVYGLCPQCGFYGPIEQFAPPPPEEFPKMLYQGTPDNYQTLVVNNATDEAAAVANGWTDVFPVPPPAKKEDGKDSKKEDGKKTEQHAGGHLFGGHHQDEPTKKK